MHPATRVHDRRAGADMPAGADDGAEDAAAPPGADVDGAPMSLVQKCMLMEEPCRPALKMVLKVPQLRPVLSSSAEEPAAILPPVDVHMAMADTALEALDTIEELHTDEWVSDRLLAVREFLKAALRRPVHEQWPSDDLELQAGGSLRLIEIVLERRPPMTASGEMVRRLYRMLLDMAILASSRFIDQQLFMSKGTPLIVKKRWEAMFPAGYLDRAFLLSRLGHSLRQVFTRGLRFKRFRYGRTNRRYWAAASRCDAASGDVAHASIWSAGDAAQASTWSANDAAAHAVTWSVPVPVLVSDTGRSNMRLSELILSTTTVEATLTETAEFWEDSLWHHRTEGEWRSWSTAQESTAGAATAAASLMESDAEESTSASGPAVAAAEPAAAAAPVDGSVQILAIVTDDFLIQFLSF